ncbi:MAG: ATP synthase subunit C, partial [Chloroflexota bacterium]|nr:ATP synthase subunit C [Chloroflexota bacterium]
MILIAALLAGLMPMIPAIIFALHRRQRAPTKAARGLVLGLTSFNVVLALMVAGVTLVWLASPSTVLAEGPETTEPGGDPYASLAAAIAIGLASISAAFAVSSTGSAAVGTIAEKPETFGRALIFVGLA